MGSWYHALFPRFRDIIEVVERFVDPEVGIEDVESVHAWTHSSCDYLIKAYTR